MHVTRKAYLSSGSAMQTSLAKTMAYDIPSDQPAAKPVPAHVAAKMRGLGVSVGKLAVSAAIGRA